MPCFCMNALAKSLELSSCAAALVQPKIGRPAARKSSTMPAASGASGPTSVKATCSSRQNRIKSSCAVSAILRNLGSAAVPALPGATKTVSTLGDCASFHASACSRPPLPITSNFMVSAFLIHYIDKSTIKSSLHFGDSMAARVQAARLSVQSAPAKSRRFGAPKVWHTGRCFPKAARVCLLPRCGLCPAR